MWDPKISSLLTKTWPKMINHWIFRIFFERSVETTPLDRQPRFCHWHPLTSTDIHGSGLAPAMKRALWLLPLLAAWRLVQHLTLEHFGTMLRHFLIVSTSCTVLFWGIHFENPLEGCSYRFFVWPQVGVSILHWHIEKVEEHDPSTWSINVH